MLINYERYKANQELDSGLKIFDISNKSKPREIAFFKAHGKGVHRPFGLQGVAGDVGHKGGMALAVLGVRGILREPGVLASVNPVFAVRFFAANGWQAFVVLGSVFLVATGAEALYADMGHFGRRPIKFSWLYFVMPALMLNYMGQGAMILTLEPAGASLRAAHQREHLARGRHDPLPVPQGVRPRIQRRGAVFPDADHALQRFDGRRQLRDVGHHLDARAAVDLAEHDRGEQDQEERATTGEPESAEAVGAVAA